MRKLPPIPYTLLCVLLVVVPAVGLLSVVAAQDGEPLPTDAEIEQMQRDLRDACEARRSDAQGRDDAERQYWLVQRRLVEAMISARELRGMAGAVGPVDPQLPVPPAATLRADAEPGEIGELVAHNGEVYWIANVAPGDRIIVQSWHVEGLALHTGWLTEDDGAALTVVGDAGDGSLPQPMRITAASLANLPAGTHELQLWVVSAPGSEAEPHHGVTNKQTQTITIEEQSE